MNKIPTIFIRDMDNRGQITNEPHPDCGWVFGGEGIATRKWDGTCCMVRDSKLYKRHEVKKGKTEPPLFEASGTVDENTGKLVGWVPVDSSDPSNKWHVKAMQDSKPLEDGTYELCGPKVQGNPEGLLLHIFIRHGVDELSPTVDKLSPTEQYHIYEGYLSGGEIEGIVWHHLDGRMAKIKAKDFGIRRNKKEA